MLRVWDLAYGSEVRSLRGHTDGVNCVAITPDGRYAASADTFDLTILDIQNGNQIHTMRGHMFAIECLAITPNGQFAVSGACDQVLKVWEIATGKEIHSYEGHERSVRCVGITPDGRFAIAGSTSTLWFWDLFVSNDVRPLPGHEVGHFIDSIAITPDGRFAISEAAIPYGERNDLKVWDIASGKTVITGSVKYFTLRRSEHALLESNV